MVNEGEKKSSMKKKIFLFLLQISKIQVFSWREIIFLKKKIIKKGPKNAFTFGHFALFLPFLACFNRESSKPTVGLSYFFKNITHHR